MLYYAEDSNGDVMNKAVIYCRQSSTADDVSESVELQKEKCSELAQKNNIEVIGIYSDQNISGKTYPEGCEKIAENDIAFQRWFNEQSGRNKFRKGFGQVIKHLPEIDYIICYDLTRIYRPATGSFLEGYINQLLIINKVKILTLNSGIINVENFSDSLIASIQNQINYDQIKIQRQKTIDALKKLKDTGEVKIGLAQVCGYKFSGIKRKVIIDEEKAKLVKDVYQKFLDTDSINATTKFINEKYKDLLGHPLRANNYRNILRQVVYTGYMFNSKNELIPCKQVKGIELITFDTWQEVQRRLDRRKIIHARPKKRSYPLSGLVYCGECGNRSTIYISRKYNVYYCIKHKYAYGKACHTHIYNTYKSKYGLGLTEALYPLLSLSILDRLNVSMNKDEKKKELAEAEVKLQNLKNKEKNITELYLDGSLEENTYKEALFNIKKDKDELNIKINKINLLLTNNDEFMKKATSLLEKITFRNLSNEEFTTCLYDVIKRIDVYENKVKITTIYGEVTLPRQILWKRQNTLPHYYFFPHKNCILVYYYMGEEIGVMFNQKFRNNEHELIANFNDKMKVYLIK